MAAVQVLSSIGMIVFSFVGGFILFYIMSPLTKMEKKEQMDHMFNQLINLVLFIWVGKILLNFSVFIRDPIAILAYPSNSHALYIAVLFTTLLLIYKGLRAKISVSQFMFSFIPVFLVASFLYEFTQMVWHNNTFTWHDLALLVGLLFVYILINDRVRPELMTILLVSGWGIGQLILALNLPFTTLFGYMIAPWFIILVMVVLNIYCLILYRKRVLSSGH